MFGNLGRNWKTTVAGVLALISSAWGAYQNPAVLNSPDVIAQIIVGIGLLTAKDSNQTGTAAHPGKTYAGDQ
jgi:hypothetical protein